MNTKITPQKLKGFRDFFAQDVAIREYVINTFKSVFEKYGYEPLETPAIEYSDIFLKESGEEASKLFYRFKDEGGRDVMLKYEVMISMCRAVAENINKITFPYKRYQIQTVWRAEKPQKGRYREFTQCDADTIGSGSVIADAEFIQMGIEALKKLGFKNFKVNISNRKFLNGLIKFSGADQTQFIPVCLSIDKLPKIGQEAVKKELLEKRKIAPHITEKILKLISYKGKNEQLIKKYKELLKDIPVGIEGLRELEEIFKFLKYSQVEEKFYQFTPYIARGLAYYTGPIFEFEIIDGHVGSVAGGGRYDEVIGKFTGRKMPATGGSFGIERIIEVIKDQKLIEIQPTPVKVLIANFNSSTLASLIKLANQLRSANIKTMIYPEATKLDKQLKYADKKRIPYIVIIGPDEIKNNQLALKDMKTGKQITISQAELISKIKKN